MTDLTNASVPIIGFAAFSGTGKTTLLEKLLPCLTRHKLRVGLIKHAHHSFDIDTPGKDSYRLRRAGASPVLIASRQRWVLMTETEGQDEPVLDDLLQHMDQDELDLILVEGFKHEAFPKIELHRPSLGQPLLFPEDESVIAIASDAPLPITPTIPLLDLNQPEQIAELLVERVSRFQESENLRE